MVRNCVVVTLYTESTSAKDLNGHLKCICYSKLSTPLIIRHIFPFCGNVRCVHVLNNARLQYMYSYLYVFSTQYS